MDFTHRTYRSTRSSTRRRNVDMPRLPSFNYLLRSVGQSITSSEPRPSLSLFPVFASVPKSVDQHSNCSESEDMSNDLKQVCRLGGNRNLISVDMPGGKSPCSDDLLSGKIKDVSRKDPWEFGPTLPLRSSQSAHVNDKTYKISKASISHDSLPRLQEVTSETTFSRPRQGSEVQNRVNSTYDPVRLRDNQSRSYYQRRRAERSTRSRTPSQRSISASSLSPSSSSCMEGMSYNTPIGSVLQMETPPSIVLRIAQPTCQNRIAGTLDTYRPFYQAVNARIITLNGGRTFIPEADPVEIDASLTQHYLEIFFDRINTPIFDVLPRSRFITWALHCSCKSKEDKLMLYALMSCASLHCSRSGSIEHRTAFKDIVYRGIQSLSSHRSLQLVHTLLFLTLTEYGDHRYQAGSNALIKSVDTIAGLKLSVEQEWKHEQRVYQLPDVIDAECRRRTFWAVYCLVKHIPFHGSPLETTDRCEIRISLPHEHDIYNCEQLSHRACFELRYGSTASSVIQDCNVLSEIAFMIQITRIYADICSHVYCSEVNLKSAYRDLGDDSFRKSIKSRLRDWFDDYNDDLQIKGSSFNDAKNRNRNHSGSNFRTEKTAGLNIVYHNSQMLSSRRTFHRGLSDSELFSQASNATIHALAVLRLTEHATSRETFGMGDYHFVSRDFSIAYAILQAIDIITAVGKVADFLEPGSRIMSLMYSALGVLDHMGSVWGHDFVRYKEVERRIQNVFRFAEVALEAGKTIFYCSHPIENATSRDLDLVYGPDRRHYICLAYIDCALIDEKDIFEIDTQ